MKYRDRDGKEKHWTQTELAQRLGITEVMVNIMENQNKGLDSLERRRTLATILRIPPVLLGLGSLDLIVVDLERPAKALELIEDAERYIDLSRKRQLVFMDVLRAKCYINLKKPEYEQAVQLLGEAIEDSKELRVARNIDHIQKIYRKLLASPYSNSPDVTDLGLMLRDLRG
jgi:transcriptional regulator with XRE-family HTH domain